MGMGGDQPRPAASDPVLAIYRVALPRVYGYLLPRCGSATLAEDLTSETFLAAVSASHQGTLTEVNVAWLVGVARHKLVDHWRRLEPAPRRCPLPRRPAQRCRRQTSPARGPVWQSDRIVRTRERVPRTDSLTLSSP